MKNDIAFLVFHAVDDARACLQVVFFHRLAVADDGRYAPTVLRYVNLNAFQTAGRILPAILVVFRYLV